MTELAGYPSRRLRSRRSAQLTSRTFRVVALVRFPLRLVFRVTAQGVDNVPAAGCVIAPNQVSNIDGVAVGCVLYPRQVRWLGKAELFKGPVAPILRRIGIISVRRGEGDIEALTTAIRFACRGRAVGIFPEGTRRAKGLRKTRRPQPHTGAARIALAAGVPLVPAAIAGTERLLVLRRWRLAFGAPVSVAGLPANRRLAARELTRRLMAAIAELEAGIAPPPRRLHPRHRIDISVGDLLFALGAAAWARRSRREEHVLRAWAGGGRGVVCLSVRTAFDLLLEALRLAPGDEVAVSAVTHPDMVRIIEAHGLRALPIDVDPETLAPRRDALERAVGPTTRMILVAHLFGGHADLAPIRAVADRHRAILVEDCAQSFRGPDDAGDQMADLSLFSFGSIKTATALGGALVRVEDQALRERMRALNDAMPVQTRSAYALRALRFLGLRGLAHPRVYASFARALASAGTDLDTVVNGAARGFGAADLLVAIRRRPSAPLLALLERRLRRFDTARLQDRAVAGRRLAAALDGVERPGAHALDPTHWLFPVTAASPSAVVASLRRAGFDASARTSAIGPVTAPSDRPDLVPAAATRLMRHVVFLPAYPELRDDRDRLAELVRR